MNAQDKSDGLFWEQFRNYYPVKAIALAVIVVLTVVSCGREASLSVAINDLNYDDRPTNTPKPKTPAAKLHVSAVALKGLLAIQSKRDLTKKERASASEHRTGVTAALAELKKEFRVNRQKLGGLDAKAAIKRLGAIETKTKALESSLRAALAEVPPDGRRASAPATNAARTLAELSPEKAAQPLSSDLAFGIKNAKPRSPSLSAGITPAYNAPSTQDEQSDLPRTPAPADLAETDETEVTPAIEQLAATLDHDAVKIHNYVYNNIEFEPYYGIRKGAGQTLAEKAGSDADQAALLIALLRESGIHARFVQGVAELPAVRAANWLGVDRARGERIDAVPEILWSGGIPTSQVKANGELKRVRFSHIWSEAFVASDSYRGVDEGLSGKAWVALDPSIKEQSFERPDTDFAETLRPSVRNWAENFASESEVIEGGAGVIAPSASAMSESTTELIESAKTALADAGINANSTVGDAIGNRSIRKRSLRYLPATTPAKQLTVSNEFRELPESLRASVSLRLSGSDPLSMPPESGSASDDAGFEFSAPTLDLGGQRITLGYAPASDDDASIVDAYHGLLNAPSYAAELVPVLRIGGRIASRGHSPSSIGYNQKLSITYRSPGFSPETVENPVVVGSLAALALDLGSPSATALLSRADSMRSDIPTNSEMNVLTDRRAGELFSHLGSLYFMRNAVFNAVDARSLGVHQQRQVSGAIVGTDVNVQYVANFPVGTTIDGLFMDVDQDSQAVVSKSTDVSVARDYIQRSGMNGSMSEGLVFEAVFKSPAVSAAKVLEIAVRQRVPIFEITQEDADQILPRLQYPPEVMGDIRAAVARPDTRVVVPERPVPSQGVGVSAFVATDGLSANYRIFDGTSGGILKFLTGPTLGVLVFTLAGYPDDLSACLFLLVDLYRIFTFPALAAMVAPLLGSILVLAGLTVPIAGILVALVLLSYLLFAILNAMRDGWFCVNGEPGFPD